MLIAGFAQFVVVDIFFRLQELTLINQYLSGGTPASAIQDGILYQPLVVSMLVYGILVAASVMSVNSGKKNRDDLELTWLGSAWILASIPLLFDFLIDSFELKLPVAVLFIYAGLGYWKGARDNPFSFVLAPLVAFIAAADGIGHLTGSFCQPSGLDACSAKAVSDTYLVIMVLVLMYFTIRGRDERPSMLLILATVLVPIVVLAGLAGLP